MLGKGPSLWQFWTGLLGATVAGAAGGGTVLAGIRWQMSPLAKEFKVVNERIVNLDDEMKEIADKAVGIDKKFDDFSEMQREMPSDAAVRDGRAKKNGRS